MALCLLFLSASKSSAQQHLSPSREILYCITQAQKTLQAIPADSVDLPRSIDHGQAQWNFVGYRDWCSGFWPGILWYLYEASHDVKWKQQATRFTEQLDHLSDRSGFDHDLGFQLFNSYGNGYRLVKYPGYKKLLLRSADSLATLFNPRVGTLLSWPLMVKKMNWPHNTIIDNMMNLELLFWASKYHGGHRLYDIAVSHAEVTMRNHFRPDYSAYHVVVYDTISGKKLKGLTHQGFADESMWARGQSWAIYGFTMCYRETHRAEFLNFAQKVADRYLRDLPANLIPYWDFNAAGLPGAPRDASAASVTASALLELSTFVKSKKTAQLYRSKAEHMLLSLSSQQYQSRNQNSAFLLHSTGHKPNGTEVDASIIYADYYYLEALVRLRKLQTGKRLYHNL